jgi:hypothetical protein
MIAAAPPPMPPLICRREVSMRTKRGRAAHAAPSFNRKVHTMARLVPLFSGLAPRRLLRAAAFSLGLVLAACGGDDDDGGAAAGTLVVSGTAATGAALGGAALELKCEGGNGSGTTQADGSYSVSLVAALPCVIRVTGSGGVVLHTLAFGSGATARANLTPATELIVARLAAADPAAFYANYDAVAAAAVTSDAVASAQAQVLALLQAAGIDFSSLGDLITGTLVARTPAAVGDAYDQALDSLAGALANSGTTLATFTSTVVASAGNAAVVALPPELLLARAAPTCSALRSGNYRIVTPTLGATMAAQTGSLVFDAAAMTGTRAGDTAATWTANGACRFTEQGATYSADVVVSQAGVMIGRLTRNGATRDFIGVPAQNHTLAELAGTWNVIGLTVDDAAAAYVGTAGTATLDDAGKFTGGINCQNNTTWAIDVCAPITEPLLSLIPPFVADADGGFAVFGAGNGSVTTRAFAYRAGSGDLLLLVVSEDGTFGFYAPDKAAPPPAVGTTIRNWNFDSDARLVPLGIGQTQSTVTSIDANAGSWTRTQRNLATTRDFTTTLFANNPRRGYVHRAGGTTTASDGSSVQLNEFTFLRLHGMGFAPVLFPTGKTFELSVGQP